MSKEVRVISDFFLLCPVLFVYAACDKKHDAFWKFLIEND